MLSYSASTVPTRMHRWVFFPLVLNMLSYANERIRSHSAPISSFFRRLVRPWVGGALQQISLYAMLFGRCCWKQCYHATYDGFCTLAGKGDVYSVFELSTCQPQCREGYPIIYSLFLGAAMQKRPLSIFTENEIRVLSTMNEMRI